MAPRLTKGEIHAHHHRLIVERVSRFRTSKRRSGMDKYLRREAFKAAVGTLRGHLIQCHQQRNLSPMLSLEELTSLHERLPASETE